MPVLSNNPPVSIELSREDAEFFKEELDEAVGMMLTALQLFSDHPSPSERQMRLVKRGVAKLELYKKMREQLAKGLGHENNPRKGR